MVRDETAAHEIHLPPSAQKVLRLLDDGDSKTFKDMVDQADIAPRTIRYALKRLKEHDLIVEKFNFHDARQVLYQRKDFVGSKDHNSAAVA